MAFLNWSFVFGMLTGTSLYITLRWMCGSKKQIICNDDCLLFSPEINSMYCLHDKYNTCGKICCCACNFKKFLTFINSAKHSLDVCLYLISSNDITDIILSLFKKGVFVRVILDKQMAAEAVNSKVNIFIKEHIPIKLINYSYTMHNKFVIIDGKKLLTGSFNWTKQGTSNNFENAIITYNENIVEKFRLYFQHMWLTN